MRHTQPLFARGGEDISNHSEIHRLKVTPQTGSSFALCHDDDWRRVLDLGPTPSSGEASQGTEHPLFHV
jgi:hypothetical protein